MCIEYSNISFCSLTGKALKMIDNLVEYQGLF